MALSDAEMFPEMDAAGWAILKRLREHPHGPKYNHRNGERLTAAGLGRVRKFGEELRAGRVGWKAGEEPGWVGEFVERCRREVPWYRGRAGWGEDFERLPLLRRDELRGQPWAFVPDGVGLADLIVYTTSGTTGVCLHLPAVPEVPNRYLPMLEVALAAHGVRMEGGQRVSIVQVCAQRKTVTNCSVMSYLQGAGFAKVNLWPQDWGAEGDAKRFLEDCAAEVYTGDPFAFHALMGLGLRARPKALVSSAMMLLPGLRRELEGHFGCPVIDLYSMNESGPVAYSLPGTAELREILPHNLFVEVVDGEGRRCKEGERGEMVLTGGINPVLPLVRYATGDFAVMDYSGVLPALAGFEGRAPVAFRAVNGVYFNSVDVSTELCELAIPYFRLHQNKDGSLRFEGKCEGAVRDRAMGELRKVFGEGQVIEWIEMRDEVLSGKPIVYSTDLPEFGR